MNRRKILIPATLIVAVLLFALATLYLPKPDAPAPPGITVISPPRAVGEFSLRDQHDAPFDLSRLRGKWTLLFFGYTRCPDVCPTALTTLKQVHRSMGDDNRNTQYVFVTVDPKHDSPQVLAQYAGYFNPDFLGVRGEDSELARLARTLGAYYRIGPPGPDGKYEIDHSAAIFLVDPDGNFRGVFSPPQNPMRMAFALRALEHP